MAAEPSGESPPKLEQNRCLSTGGDPASTIFPCFLYKLETMPTFRLNRSAGMAGDRRGSCEVGALSAMQLSQAAVGIAGESLASVRARAVRTLEQIVTRYARRGEEAELPLPLSGDGQQIDPVSGGSRTISRALKLD